ncbi:MAG: A24 family peptidase [Clostridia bacterium]|nr:A24 family peptidase [Clostridia bacterium]
MHPAISIVIAIILGLLIGIGLTYIFKIIPEKWLQDYGYNPNSPKFRPAKRMKLIPHGILAGVFCAAFYVASILFFPQLYMNNRIIHIVAVAIIVPILFLVLISDRLNRIIPDQFWVMILVLGFVLLLSDYLEGTIWFSSNAPWYAPLVNRIGGAVIGGGLLWLIGFIAETFTGRDAMGQGDMKLLLGCGMATGIYGLVVTFYVSVIVGVLFAIPLLIKKQIRLKKEEEEIKASDNPKEKRKEIQRRKAQVHFSEDPDYLAFGPFLALGAGVFLALEPVFLRMLAETLITFGLYF